MSNYCAENPYRTPEGYRDSPYWLIYDGNALTNGQTYRNRSVICDGDPFLLRRVCGMQNVVDAGQFQYYNASRSAVFSSPVTINDNYNQFGVAPEKTYPGAGQITFDLFTVAKTADLAYIGFQGVRRLRGNPGYPTVASGPYTLKPMKYVLDIGPITWTKGGAQRVFSVPMELYDFELYRITQVNAATGGAISGVLNYTMYDYSGRVALSNLPVPDSYMMDTPIRPTAQASMSPGIFPVPALVYGKSGQIKLDAYGALTVAGEQTVQVVFHGANRVPCG